MDRGQLEEDVRDRENVGDIVDNEADVANVKGRAEISVDNNNNVNNAGKRSSYTIFVKIQVLQALELTANNNNVSRTTRQMGVIRRHIQRLRVDRDVMGRLRDNRRYNTRRQRRRNYEVRRQFPGLETRLLEWVQEQHKLENSVSNKRLRQKASKLKEEYWPKTSMTIHW